MIHTLSQFASTPPALPPAPLWEKYLLESPGVPVVVLVAAAITSFVLLNRQGRAGRGATVAGVLAVLAAGVAALAYTVTTDREAMKAATRDLVRAVATIDTAVLERLLAPDAKFLSQWNVGELRVPALGLGKPAIIQRVADAMRQYPLDSASVVEAQAEITGTGLGRTQVRVRVVPVALNAPHTSWWRLEWRQTPTGDWQAITITPVSLDFVGG